RPRPLRGLDLLVQRLRQPSTISLTEQERHDPAESEERPEWDRILPSRHPARGEHVQRGNEQACEREERGTERLFSQREAKQETELGVANAEAAGEERSEEEEEPAERCTGGQVGEERSRAAGGHDQPDCKARRKDDRVREKSVSRIDGSEQDKRGAEDRT